MSTPRLKSRRKPMLRVISPDGPAMPRHATSYTIGDRPVIAEVWTYDEWSKLCEAERPGEATRLPGLGWIVLRWPFNEFETEDVLDVARQDREWRSAN